MVEWSRAPSVEELPCYPAPPRVPWSEPSTFRASSGALIELRRGGPGYRGQMLNVVVTGAAGRLGTYACAAIDAAPDLSLVGAVDQAGATPLPPRGTRTEDLEVHPALTPAVLERAAVVLELTNAAGAESHARLALETRTAVVVGASGLSAEAMDALGGLATEHGTGIVVVPNFSLGAVLLVRLAALAAPHFASVEVIELHHDQKLDAPSGTARHTLDRLAAARSEAGLEAPRDATADEALRGARGGVGAGGIHVHSVRLPGLIAHEEILFGAAGETLTLRHDSYDRSSFVAGILLALRSAPTRRGLTVGLDDLLD